jgi:Zn-dependent peptidase ImmA (M78 family)
MAMTLRTGPDEEAALAKLAKRWGVSKQAAALRAIREEAERHDEDLLATSDRLAERYAEALDRLGRA